MVSQISDETEIQAPAAKVWELYGTLEFSKFVPIHLSNLVQKIDVLEGDGGEGTLFLITFVPVSFAPIEVQASNRKKYSHFEGGMQLTGLGGPASYKEKYIKVDNEKRLKIAEMVEGGYLDYGFTLYRLHLEIIEKSENSCIVKSTIEYELKEEAAANISLATVQPLVAIAQAANKYFINEQAKEA